MDRQPRPGAAPVLRERRGPHRRELGRPSRCWTRHIRRDGQLPGEMATAQKALRDAEAACTSAINLERSGRTGDAPGGKYSAHYSHSRDHHSRDPSNPGRAVRSYHGAPGPTRAPAAIARVQPPLPSGSRVATGQGHRHLRAGGRRDGPRVPSFFYRLRKAASEVSTDAGASSLRTENSRETSTGTAADDP